MRERTKRLRLAERRSVEYVVGLVGGGVSFRPPELDRGAERLGSAISGQPRHMLVSGHPPSVCDMLSTTLSCWT